MITHDNNDNPFHGWHLDKRVNVGHILTTIVIAASMFAWGYNMDRRVTTLEVRQDNNVKTIEKLGADIKDALSDINAKMDRMIERELKR